MSNSPGWYDDPRVGNLRRYWDGQAWTEDTYEMPGQVTPTKMCPYCATSIPMVATRCPSCAGDFFYCKKDGWVGATSKSVNVGLLRGGRQTQRRCMECGRVVDGPKF